MRRTSLLLITLALSSCGPQGSETTDAQKVSLVYAKGWDQVTLTVSGAKTVVDDSGHFSTVPNACYRREVGSLRFELWNRLAVAINAALQMPALPEPDCQPKPSDGADLYQPIEVQRKEQKISLIRQTGNEYCSTISDRTIVIELGKVAAQIAWQARYDECPQ